MKIFPNSLFLMSPLVMREYCGIGDEGQFLFKLLWPESAEEAFVELEMLRENTTMSVFAADTSIELDGNIVMLKQMLGEYVVLERVG